METLTAAAAIDPLLDVEIAELLRRTGHAQHQAYLTTDGD
jgi:hypothetical protein